MSKTTRLAGLFIATLAFASPLYAAQPQWSGAERVLFDAANRDRAALGLPLLQWDTALANAAREHALRMAQQNALSHQLPGELTLQQRATGAGARFQVIAENIAVGPNANGIHAQWMNSAPHRANLLDPQLSAVGIAVAQGNGNLFAVEDFLQMVANLTLDAQELQVGAQLSLRGLHLTNATSDARKTCEMDRGFAGNRPFAVIRYETADLSRFPDDIEQKIQSGKYHSAAVGACDAGGRNGFARFRIAVLLF
jgi:uncharacterized protein YkwD